MDKKTKHADSLHQEEQKKGDLEALVEHMRTNPGLYIAGVVFVVLAVLAGMVVQWNSVRAEQEAAGEFITALDTEDWAVRETLLEPVAQSGAQMSDEALYLAAEAAFRAGNLDKASELFGQVRTQHPESEYVPQAVEGQGNVAEDKKDYQAALGHYKEVLEKWPLTFAGRRQQLNIGRIHEALGEWQPAADAYKAQLDLFPESSFAQRAQQALDTLEQVHPEVKSADSTEEPATDAAATQSEAAPQEEAPAAPENAAPEAAPADAPAATDDAAATTETTNE